MKRIALLMISLLLCFAAGAAAENTQPAPDETYECGDYAYILLEDGSAEVTGYAGAASKLEVPGELDGYPVTTIGDSAFWECKSLTDITIPDSVTTIGDSAFGWCDSLTDITIPDSVVSMGGNPFVGCDNLQTITVSPDHPNLAMIDNVLFDKTEKKLIGYPAGRDAANYEIPQGITSIGDAAFGWCNSLTDITIPDSVITIGDAAFEGCDSLTDITIPDSVTTIGDAAFYGCKSLTSITLPDSVTTIGDFTFGLCDSLTSITLPDSVTTIGNAAFWECKSLTDITIPDSVTTIGDSAFYGCNSLILTVGRDSYAKQYAVENGIQYTYPDANNWLYE
ncbi:MAG: leucine-rich repeat protein [Candidatus Limiplasma sp.]|nr:leucine-rich repeat protein [Candidatus Limiplasma sp.]